MTHMLHSRIEKWDVFFGPIFGPISFFPSTVIMTSIGKSVDASNHLHCFVYVRQTFDPFNGKLIQRCGEICRPHAMLCGQLLSIFL